MEGSVIKRPLRFLLLGFLRQILRLRSQPLVLDPGSTVVVVAPHPDDEVFGCGLLLAHPPASGLTFHVVFLTRGEASHPGHPVLPPVDLALRRSAEAECSAGRLGVSPAALHFLDLPDGRLGHMDPTELAVAGSRFGVLLERLRPSVVLVAAAQDGSTEHTAAFRIVQACTAKSDSPWRCLGYLVWSAWSPRLLARVAFGAERIRRHHVGGGAGAKRRAALAYRSQTEPVPPWRKPVLPADFIAALARDDEFFLEYGP